MAANLTDNIFKCIFLNENSWILIKISLKFVPKGFILQYSIIGSDNGLAPSRWQAIIWTNNGSITNAYMRHSASMSLNKYEVCYSDKMPIQNGNPTKLLRIRKYLKSFLY